MLRSGRDFYYNVGWSAYEDYIGQKHFVAGFNHKLASSILHSTRVASLLKSLSSPSSSSSAQSEGKYAGKTLKELEEMAGKQLMGLMASFDSRTRLRTMAYVANQLFIKLYDQGIHVNDAQLRVLRETAKEAERQGVSLFFLPCHKSHIDYMVVNYLFFRIGISLPFVAAGDNLNLPIVGSILRGGGAFFIRRTFADDPLYGALFKEYIAV